eukprot:14480445-Alexandrium_andersonii.AAC.1
MSCVHRRRFRCPAKLGSYAGGQPRRRAGTVSRKRSRPEQLRSECTSVNRAKRGSASDSSWAGAVEVDRLVGGLQADFRWVSHRAST